MTHTLELTTAECILITGIINTLGNETDIQAIQRVSEKIKGRVLYDLRQAEIERNKWKEMDDDL